MSAQPTKKKPMKFVAKSKTSAQKKSGYTAENITVLEGLDPVRKRPGMYIGNTAEAGLHHLIWEVLDNSIDEAMAGFCTHIEITLNKDGGVTVVDNGRGIPVDMHKATKKSALETVMTTLHAGGKFGDGGYKVSGGLHGVGISVVNALSSLLVAEVHRDGKVWRQEYMRGKPKAKVKPVGATKRTGTTITFTPDPQIFTVTEFSWRELLDHLRRRAYLTKGITLTAYDKRVQEKDKPALPADHTNFILRAASQATSAISIPTRSRSMIRYSTRTRQKTTFAWKSRCNTPTTTRKHFWHSPIISSTQSTACTLRDSARH